MLAVGYSESCVKRHARCTTNTNDSGFSKTNIWASDMRSTGTFFHFARWATIVCIYAARAAAQTQGDFNDAAPIESVIPAATEDRMLGVLPSYLVVSDSSQRVAALTKKQKFSLFFRETTDPSTFLAAGVAAGLSQSGNNTPSYGVGAGAYGQRLGAAYADIALGNFFSDALLASAFHQDPRYYRMGPGHSVARRTLYSLSRLVITRQDSGRSSFNVSGLLGTSLAIGLSNAYYPESNVNGSTVSSHFMSNAIGASFGNLIPEFWPDLKQKFSRHHHTAKLAD